MLHRDALEEIATERAIRITKPMVRREGVSGQVAAGKAARRDGIATWFDYLDVDDFATFGGKA